MQVLAPEEKLQRKRDRNCRWRRANKDKQAIYARRYHLKHKNSAAPIRGPKGRRKEWQISKERVATVLAHQNGGCAICEKPLNGKHRRGPQRDHDHKTNRLRGILCIGCNRGLGFFCDSIKNLEKAIVYLEVSML